MNVFDRLKIVDSTYVYHLTMNVQTIISRLEFRIMLDEKVIHVLWVVSMDPIRDIAKQDPIDRDK